MQLNYEGTSMFYFDVEGQLVSREKLQPSLCNTVML